MNSVLNNLIIFNGYPLSVVVALGFHTLIFVVFIFIQNSTDVDALELVQPTIIKALIIDENPQVVNRQNLERQRIQQQQQREAEQERQRQEAERQRLEEQQRQEAERQRREEEQRQAALRERDELERQRAEQLRREQERAEQLRREQERAEDLRRQAEQAEAERRRQQELERQRAAQAATEAAAAEAARNEFELVQSATGLIQQIVQENWSRPPSARNGMRAILQIQMLPTGELLDVRITQSSGDPAFDRSAENAVYRAAPFSELQSLPINVFNSNFRSLSLIFEPEDLLN